MSLRHELIFNAKTVLFYSDAIYEGHTLTGRHAVHGRRFVVLDTYQHAYCYSDAISWNVPRVETGSTCNFFLLHL